MAGRPLVAERCPEGDLDSASGRFADAARAGRLLREILDDFDVRSYPKTSGARGLHVLVPLRRGATQDTVRAFAMEIGDTMAERAPALVTVAMSKSERAHDALPSGTCWHRICSHRPGGDACSG